MRSCGERLACPWCTGRCETGRLRQRLVLAPPATEAVLESRVKSVGFMKILIPGSPGSFWTVRLDCLRFPQ